MTPCWSFSTTTDMIQNTMKKYNFVKKQRSISWLSGTFLKRVQRYMMFFGERQVKTSRNTRLNCKLTPHLFLSSTLQKKDNDTCIIIIASRLLLLFCFDLHFSEKKWLQFCLIKFDITALWIFVVVLCQWAVFLWLTV